MSDHLIQAIKEEYARNRERRKQNNQWVLTAWKEIQVALHHFHGAKGIKVSSVEGNKAEIEVWVFNQYRFKVYLLPDKTSIAFGCRTWDNDICYSKPSDMKYVINHTITLMGSVLEEADYDMLVTSSGLSLQQEAKGEIE